MNELESQNESETNKKFQKRNKRLKNYWEPIYDPSFSGTLGYFDWNTTLVNKIENKICTAEALEVSMKDSNAKSWSILESEFISCDFLGDFKSGLRFKGSIFENCDFGQTTWEGIKFTECIFKKCSFTLTTFEKCQFINCHWKESGISGTETKLFDNVISNPERFVKSGYTNTDKSVLEKNKKTAAYQKMRLEETKMKLSRHILSNNERNADDAIYYDSVKLYLQQSVRAKKAAYRYRMGEKNIIYNLIKLLLAYIESTVLSLSGPMNAWGGSIARPTIIGACLIIAFSLIYYIFQSISPPCQSWSEALMRSFDISLLFGYTKHASRDISFFSQTLFGLNALLGLWWYAIFVPTLINRICRVR